MVSTSSTMMPLGSHAPEFSLPDTQGNTIALSDFSGAEALLVMFICNHCPYVKAVLPRLVRDCRELAGLGIGCVAIMSNDPADYPEDSPENMQRIAAAMDFPFPYLLDASQAVAKAYGAVCTPDFFGFDAGLGLQYRGRLDASGKNPAPDDARRELFEAMRQVAETGHGPAEQTPSIGCSIKWRAPC